MAHFEKGINTTMITLQKQGDKYRIYINEQYLGEVECHHNTHHMGTCYVKVNMPCLDVNISEELFTKLKESEGCPLQAMADSSDVAMVEFLNAGGFLCKRKCYEVDAAAEDYIGGAGDVQLCACTIGELEYEECCRMVYQYYAETHKAVNPLTSDLAAFCAELPGEAAYAIHDNQIASLAFVESNEIAYVCGVDNAHFVRFACSLVASILAEHDTVFFEADDCDWAAMALRSLFKNLDDVSYDTYILGDAL